MAVSNTQNPMLFEAGLDEAGLLALVGERFPEAEKEEEWLFWKQHTLRVKFMFGEIRRIDDVFRVQLLLIARHPWFDEDLVLTLPSFAPDPEQAMRSGISTFCEGTLPCLLAAFGNETDGIIEADVYGRQHAFRVPKLRTIVHKGDGEPFDMFAAVQDILPQYLGTKHWYWMELSSAAFGDKPDCDVRINGTSYPGITEVLLQKALDRKNGAGYASDRQFVLLIQQPETLRQCPFTKQQVGELTAYAIRTMLPIKDAASSRMQRAAIREAAPTHSLGIEMVAFLPEIIAHQTVQYMDSDILRPSGGTSEAELRKSQVRSYGYMEDAVFQYLHKTRPEKGVIEQLLTFSVKFRSLHENVGHGTDILSLAVPPLVYRVDEAYEVW
ncbi:MAG: hypothetical protein IKN55_05160 [Oscillospiraceae bacterium]|nr:hypothetical protein [Oscillospiraceae bacterium]